jgi:hypothetical protein
VEKRTEIQELIREQVRERPLLVPMPVSLPAAIVEPGKPVAEGGLTIENIQHFHNEPAAQRTEPARTISAPVAQPTPVTYRPLQVQARMSAPESQRDTLAPRAAETARMATPAPSIQVSIGRIEIKANPASASPAAKPKAAPTTLSLDDYLKQRKGDR